MKFRFIKPASDELDEAFEHYEREQEGLGIRFLAHVRAGIDTIVRQPTTWPSVDKTRRKFLLRRFPYAIIYSATTEPIVIVAIAHLRRRPGYWKRRQ